MPRAKGCPECGSDMHVQKRPYSFYGVYFGRFDAYTCPHCKLVLFGEKASVAIQAVAKEKGLWGQGSVGRARRMVATRRAARSARSRS